MCKHHEEYMRKAIALSRQSMNSAGGPFGAVIVKDGRIIGEGMNRVTVDNDPSAHAEVVAIRQACKALDDYSLKGAVIYSSCEPCPMCLSAIYWARLDTVYFGNTQEDAAKIDFDDAFLYEQVSLPHQSRSIPIKPLLRNEAVDVFHEWADKDDKTPY